jgi:hypothetical protein
MPSQAAHSVPFANADAFRHSGWAPNRRRVIRALNDTFVHPNRIERFIACGGDAWIEQRLDGADAYRVRSTTCNDRWCLPCQRQRSNTIATALAKHVSPKDTRFITLTIRSSDEPLRSQVKRLFRVFRILRKMPVWRTTQTGGAMFVEVSRNTETGLWHPHLHVIAQGRFVPQEELSKAWCAATGDSHIVDIRWVRNAEHAIRYVSKYASSGVSQSVMTDPAALAEAMRALKGTRLCTTFGTWRGTPLRGTPPEGMWERVCSLHELAEGLKRGQREAINLLAAIEEASPGVFRRLAHPEAEQRPPPSTEQDAFNACETPDQDLLWCQPQNGCVS